MRFARRTEKGENGKGDRDERKKGREFQMRHALSRRNASAPLLALRQTIGPHFFFPNHSTPHAHTAVSKALCARRRQRQPRRGLGLPGRKCGDIDHGGGGKRRSGRSSRPLQFRQHQAASKRPRKSMGRRVSFAPDAVLETRHMYAMVSIGREREREEREKREETGDARAAALSCSRSPQQRKTKKRNKKPPLRKKNHTAGGARPGAECSSRCSRSRRAAQRVSLRRCPRSSDRRQQG